MGLEDRRKNWFAAALTVLALLVVGESLFRPGMTVSIAASDKPTHSRPTRGADANRWDGVLDPTLHCAKLKIAENTEYEGNGRNIFQSASELHDAELHPSPRPGPPPLVLRTKAPTFPLTFFGFAASESLARKAFFADGDALFVASEGEIIDRRYKIMKIDGTSVEVEDLIDQSKHTLSLDG